MGHTLLQAPHSMQSDVRSGKTAAKRLNTDRHAPRGQITLQKNRRCPMTKMISVKSIASRTERVTTSVVPLIIAQGIADSIVATGQSRQKYSGKFGLRK